MISIPTPCTWVNPPCLGGIDDIFRIGSHSANGIVFSTMYQNKRVAMKLTCCGHEAAHEIAMFEEISRDRSIPSLKIRDSCTCIVSGIDQFSYGPAIIRCSIAKKFMQITGEKMTTTNKHLVPSHLIDNVFNSDTHFAKMIIMDVVDGDVFTLMSKETECYYIYQCALALEKLHASGMIHGDTHLRNFFVLKRQVLLGDFGTSQYVTCEDDIKEDIAGFISNVNLECTHPMVAKTSLEFLNSMDTEDVLVLFKQFVDVLKNVNT
jgi:serine/threonine protein kinase